MSHKILVIEDDEDQAFLANKILSHHGYTVTIAKNGRSGIEQVKEEKPDLILVDVSLPDIGGLEVVKQIKGIEGCEVLPIIAMTAYDMKGETLAAGCTAFIAKPFELEPFIAEVKKHLKE